MSLGLLTDSRVHMSDLIEHNAHKYMRDFDRKCSMFPSFYKWIRQATCSFRYTVKTCDETFENKVKQKINAGRIIKKMFLFFLTSNQRWGPFVNGKIQISGNQ